MKKRLPSQKGDHLKTMVRVLEGTMVSENHQEESNEGGNKDNMGELHLEGSTSSSRITGSKEILLSRRSMIQV